ncbi:hypothetical protein GGG16DRAFT_117467 [Schizophyllum commune]
MNFAAPSVASSSPVTWAYQPSFLEAQAALGVDRDIWYWPRAPDEYQSLGGAGSAMAWMSWHESQAQAWWQGYRACQAQLAATLYPIDSDQHSSQQAPSASPLPSSAQPPLRSNLAAPEVHALETACYEDHLNMPVPSDDGHALEEDIVDYAYGCSSRHLLSDYVDDVYFSPPQAQESDAGNSSSASSSSSDSLSSSADELDDSLPAHAWSECDGAYSFDAHGLADDPIPAALRARHSFSDVKRGPTGRYTLQATKTLPLYAEERQVPIEI